MQIILSEVEYVTLCRLAGLAMAGRDKEPGLIVTIDDEDALLEINSTINEIYVSLPVSTQDKIQEFYDGFESFFELGDANDKKTRG